MIGGKSGSRNQMGVNYYRNECHAVIPGSHAVSVAGLNFSCERWRKEGHAYVEIISKELSGFFHLKVLLSFLFRVFRW